MMNVYLIQYKVGKLYICQVRKTKASQSPLGFHHSYSKLSFDSESPWEPICSESSKEQLRKEDQSYYLYFKKPSEL